MSFSEGGYNYPDYYQVPSAAPPISQNENYADWFTGTPAADLGSYQQTPYLGPIEHDYTMVSYKN